MLGKHHSASALLGELARLGWVSVWVQENLYATDACVLLCTDKLLTMFSALGQESSLLVLVVGTLVVLRDTIPKFFLNVRVMCSMHFVCQLKIKQTLQCKVDTHHLTCWKLSWNLLPVSCQSSEEGASVAGCLVCMVLCRTCASSSVLLRKIEAAG